MERPGLETTSHLVAHLLREVENAVRAVLRVDACEDGQGSRSDERKIVHKPDVKAILARLGIEPDEPVGRAWLSFAGRGKPFALHSWAHRGALDRPRPIDNTFQEFWNRFESVFDAVLDKFEGRYLEWQAEIGDHLLLACPTAGDAKRLRNARPANRIARTYFFERAGVQWLKPLMAAGFFKRPPPCERDLAAGTISFMPWPESAYLARMASEAPELVCEITLEVPHSDNPFVHRDLAEVGCGLRPSDAARVAMREVQWLRSQGWLFDLLPPQYGKLISHLSEAGEVRAALGLAKELLCVVAHPTDAGEGEEEERWWSLPEPKACVELYHYEEILKENVPDLVGAAGIQALELLCDLLENAVSLSPRPEVREERTDLSYSWRPAIEDHEQNRDRGEKDLLVTAVRDAAEQLVESERNVVLGAVEGRGFDVFTRIGLHLRRLFPEADPEGTASLLSAPEVFDNHELHHERFLLLQEVFGDLPPETKQAYLELVANLDVQWWVDSVQERSGEGPNADEVARYRRRKQHERLQPIKAFLTSPWAERFQELQNEFGPREHAEFMSYSEGVVTGPVTPRAAEELQRMAVRELVEFLRKWQPQDRWKEGSPEGLGRELTSATAEEPGRFAREAGAFEGLEPTYLRSLVQGFQDAVKQGRPFDWPPVLGLCGWALNQEREDPDEKREWDDRDPGWGWCRKAIAGLLGSGCEQGECEIDLEHRRTVWSLLEELTRDTDPTEQRANESSFDPMTLSINTVRGEAMHSVVRYALWVRRHLESEGDEEGLRRRFEEMPEVRKVLEEHLDTDQDPSPAIRAVYAVWFAWLLVLDNRWATENATRIFPTDAGADDWWHASWDTYVNYCPAYDSVLDALQSRYAHAIDMIAPGGDEDGRLRKTDQRLAEHLMVYYWGGKLELDGAKGLLERFYDKAPPELRKSALLFVGWQLDRHEGNIGAEVIERLKTLWERRAAAARQSEEPNALCELEAFGPWFTSGRFDPGWAVQQLEKALAAAGYIERDCTVVEDLAALADQTPLEAVRCLRHIVEGARHQWSILGYKGDAHELLERALASGNQGAAEAATDLVHRLAAAGHLDFGDLIRWQDREDPGRGST